MIIKAAGASAASPKDENVFRSLQDACQKLSDTVSSLVGNEGEQIAQKNLRNAAKIAVATTIGLVTTSKVAAGSCSDTGFNILKFFILKKIVSAENLKNTSKLAADAISNLINALQQTWKDPDNLLSQQTLINECHNYSPLGYKLVAAAKSSLPKISDSGNKQILKQAADEAAEALQKLISVTKSLTDSKGQAEIDTTLELLAAEEAHLNSTLMEIETGNFIAEKGQSSEGALQLLNIAAKEVYNTNQKLNDVDKTNTEELYSSVKSFADSIIQANTSAKVLASTLYNKQIQNSILETSKDLTKEARNMILSVKAVTGNINDPTLHNLLVNNAQNLANILSNLLNVAKESLSGIKECDDAINTIRSSLNSLKIIPHDSNEFPSFAEELENNTKAIQTAIFALVNAAKNNSKNLGPSAKTTANTFNSVIDSVNNTSGSCHNLGKKYNNNK